MSKYQWSEELQDEIVKHLEIVAKANKANGYYQPCWAGKLLAKIKSSPKCEQMTWTPEQQERVLQLVDYCSEMTTGYLSGWAKSLMADLKGDGLNIIERQILKDGVAAMNMRSATLHYPSLEDRQHEEIINLLEKILLERDK